MSDLFPHQYNIIKRTHNEEIGRPGAVRRCLLKRNQDQLYS